ncbi:sugar dehydratase, partial [candidate division WWE3 bacterium CG09_land_8_20_14_0_10_39_24]
VSSQKALDLLNWKPAYSLEEGLEETYKWYKSFLAESN